MNQVRLLVRRAIDAGPAQALRRLRSESNFRHQPGTFRGVYATFEDAAHAAPPGKVGYDHPELAAAYRERIGQRYASDYPVMFWLQRAIDAGARRVFDWGGHVGIAYHTYREWMQFPDSLTWQVCDLPNMVEQGRALGAERGAAALTFTTRTADADGSDVLCTQGALQYIDKPLAELIGGLTRPPRHLLINKVPLVDGPGFITLQNTLYAYTPYAAFGRAEFLGSLHRLRYEVVDAWLTPELGIRIPYDSVHVVPSYSGLYLQRS